MWSYVKRNNHFFTYVGSFVLFPAQVTRVWWGFIKPSCRCFTVCRDTRCGLWATLDTVLHLTPWTWLKVWIRRRFWAGTDTELPAAFQNWNRLLSFWCFNDSPCFYCFSLTDASAAERNDVFGINGQIEQKLDFLRKRVPRETGLVLVGHSIGCYIILEMMKRDPELKVWDFMENKKQKNKEKSKLSLVSRSGNKHNCLFLFVIINRRIFCGRYTYKLIVRVVIRNAKNRRMVT